jgi:hypothetical protein
MFMCVCLRILASSRIPRYVLGDIPLISDVALSHLSHQKLKLHKNMVYTL